MAFYRNHGKRALDLAASVGALVLLSPVFAVVAVAVATKLGRPVLFSQERTGRSGRAFRIYKFRSMTDERDERGELLPDDRRLTGFGRWLRASSLDEIPALINIIRGEMSLVGPRPHVHRYLERYDAVQLRRFEVRPGLTGWAMVNGRNAISWGEKFAYDVWYVDRMSFLLDLKILGMTVYRVIGSHGVSAPDQATMPEFLGERADADGDGRPS